MRIKANAGDVFDYLTRPANIALWRFGARDVAWASDGQSPAVGAEYKIAFKAQDIGEFYELHRITKLETARLVAIAISATGQKSSRITEIYEIEDFGKSAVVTCTQRIFYSSALRLFRPFIRKREKQLFNLNTLRLRTALETRPPND